MSGIFQALKGIYTFFLSIGEFIVKLFNDLIIVVKLIGKAIIKVPTYLSFMPALFVAIFVVALCVIIIYKVAGRD